MGDYINPSLAVKWTIAFGPIEDVRGAAGFTFIWKCASAARSPAAAYLCVVPSTDRIVYGLADFNEFAFRRAFVDVFACFF